MNEPSNFRSRDIIAQEEQTPFPAFVTAKMNNH